MQLAAYTHAYTVPRRADGVIDTSRQTSGTYLRLLHLVLGVHLCDDLVHVGFQDHPSHHHLCQNVVHLRKTRSFQLRERSNFKQRNQGCYGLYSPTTECWIRKICFCEIFMESNFFGMFQYCIYTSDTILIFQISACH